MNQIYLKKLQLTNYRNLDNGIYTFSENINCIFGDNGNGKTNLLEAVFYLINRKSFRKNTSFQQIISVESEKPEILFSAALAQENSVQKSVTGKINNEQTQWFLDNKQTNKKIDLKTVFINPFDSFSFHSTSSFRRNWIDTYLSMLDPAYKRCLSQFNTSLRFRNNLLSKKPQNYKEQILANNPKLSELTVNLIRSKKQFLKEIKQYCDLTFKIIFNNVHNLELELTSKFARNSYEEVLMYYNSSIEKDSIIGHTTSGVHRDDYIFLFDGYNSYEYCSLGQQKMSFLSLLFAYIELFRYKFNAYPMVLIDDVSGELDERRWKNLISYLEAKKFQVLISTANRGFKKELEQIEEAKKIFLENGKLSFH
jgi:DNA replication and repair protein RecF